MVCVSPVLVAQGRPVFLRVHFAGLQPEARIIHTRKAGHNDYSLNPRNHLRGLNDGLGPVDGWAHELLLELARLGIVVKSRGEVED